MARDGGGGGHSGRNGEYNCVASMDLPNAVAIVVGLCFHSLLSDQRWIGPNQTEPSSDTDLVEQISDHSTFLLACCSQETKKGRLDLTTLPMADSITI